VTFRADQPGAEVFGNRHGAVRTVRSAERWEGFDGNIEVGVVEVRN
jgi:hypothetical protein